MMVKNKVSLGKQIYLSDENDKKERKIEIVFTIDDNYSKQCSALMTSILLNSDNSSLFRFHILDGGIKNDNKNKIIELKKLRDFEIQFYDMSSFDFSKFPLNNDNGSYASYYKLFILDILSNDIKKAIYLDCDIIVEKDLKDLWEINIDNYLLAAIEDFESKKQPSRLNYPIENNYFNTGVLLLNIEKLRGFDFKRRCINYYLQNQNCIIFQSKDILNGVLNGKCKFLSLNWNVNGKIYTKKSLNSTFIKKDIENAKYNPFIIHYSDTFKPWQESSRHPLWEEYWKYLSYTPFVEDFKKHKLNRKKYIIKAFINTIFNLKNLFSINNEYNFDKTDKQKIIKIFYMTFKVKSKKKIKV